MREVLSRREVVADAARRFAPTKRYWAVVGSGVNKVAAEEVRIKLSELCYKSIACDVIEDKKHIDLSSEPLILVCAAGLAGSTADDVGKEIAIFRAHKATPIVIADDGDARYPAAAVIAVPAVDPALGFVMSAMAGHIFGYEAALAIDATARPLREAMEVIERAVGEERSADVVLTRIRREIPRYAGQYLDGLRSHRYDGHLEASTAVRLAGLLRDVQSERPVEEYQAGSGKVGSPSALVWSPWAPIRSFQRPAASTSTSSTRRASASSSSRMGLLRAITTRRTTGKQTTGRSRNTSTSRSSSARAKRWRFTARSSTSTFRGSGSRWSTSGTSS